MKTMIILTVGAVLLFTACSQKTYKSMYEHDSSFSSSSEHSKIKIPTYDEYQKK